MTTTASIYFNRIRIDYPQAGKDNDSQGFRDNFRNIFNAFSATNVDIESLKLNAVTLGGNNDFGYNAIRKATLQSFATKSADYSVSPVSGTINVDYREGNYQKYKVTSGASTFNIENWPIAPSTVTSIMSEIKLSVTPNTSTTATITFSGNVITVGNVTLPVTLNTTTSVFFDLWSDDNGTTIYVSQKGV